MLTPCTIIVSFSQHYYGAATYRLHYDNDFVLCLIANVNTKWLYEISYPINPPTEKRKSEAERIRVKYPERIPVIAEKHEKSQITDIDKKKFVLCISHSLVFYHLLHILYLNIW